MNRFSAYYLCSLLLATGMEVFAEQSSGSGLEFSGKLMLDWSSFDGIHSNQERTESLFFRRADIKAKFGLSESASGRVQLAYDKRQDQLEVRDWQFRLSSNDGGLWKVGKFKEPFGLERSTGATSLISAERSMATQAFTPSRNFGVAVMKFKKRYSWQVGVFDNSKDFKHFALSSRVTRNSNRLVEDSKLHLGLNLSFRSLDEKEKFRVNEPVAVYLADSVIESKKINAESEQLYGVEAAFAKGNWLWQSEYFWRRLDGFRDNTSVAQEHSGGYTQLSLNLFGSGYAYKNGNFRLRREVSNKPLLLYLKGSSVDVLDDTKGVKAYNLLLGAKWHLDKQWAGLIEIGRAYLLQHDSEQYRSGNALTVRLFYKH